MLGAWECGGKVCDPHKGGALKLGTDARLEDGEGVLVSVPGLQEEVVGGRGLMSACGMSKGRRGVGSGWVGRDGGNVRREGRLNDRLDNGIDVHVR